MKLRLAPFLRNLLLTCSSLYLQAWSQEVIKADNADNLNLASSWLNAASAPSAGNIAHWNNNVSAANSVLLGQNTSWSGIKISAPGGSVSIMDANTVKLTLGAGGIDMSQATQDLNIRSEVVTAANQIWHIAANRRLSFGSSQNARLSGAHEITLKGGGTFDANQPATNGFSASSFRGKWVVEADTTLRGCGNGNTWSTSNATDTITLKGGSLVVGGVDGSGAQGNWRWSNNITLAANSDSYIAARIPSASYNATRWLQIQGVISGSGNLGFKNLSVAGVMSDDRYGFILSSENSFSGKLTIHSGAFVRIGGSQANNADAGNFGSLPPTVEIINNGVLRLTRNNSWSFANPLSGSGELKIGTNLGGSNDQVVRVLGAKSYTGNTYVDAGKLVIEGDAKLYAAANSARSLRVGNQAVLQVSDFSQGGSLGLLNLAGEVLQLDGGTLEITGETQQSTRNFNVTNNGATLRYNVADHSLSLNGNQSGSAQISLLGDLLIDTSSKIVIAANIAGSGKIVKSGNGNLLFKAPLATTGALELQAGKLILEAASSAGSYAIAKGAVLQLGENAGIPAAAVIANEGELVYAQNSSQQLHPQLSGSGALRITAGELIINQSPQYTGNTLVSAASLQLQAELKHGELQLLPASRVSGNIITAGNIISAGTIQPGSSGQSGKFKCQGNLSLQAGSLTELDYLLQDGSMQLESLQVAGSITLGGTLRLNAQSAQLQPNKIYRLFSASVINSANFDVATQLQLPTPPQGFKWSTRRFATDGFVALLPQHSDGDMDKDGLSDEDELLLGTNPQRPDSDGDGIGDKEEIELGSDPNDASDPNPENGLVSGKDSDGDGVVDSDERTWLGSDAKDAESFGKTRNPHALPIDFSNPAYRGDYQGLVFVSAHIDSQLNTQIPSREAGFSGFLQLKIAANGSASGYLQTAEARKLAFKGQFGKFGSLSVVLRHANRDEYVLNMSLRPQKSGYVRVGANLIALTAASHGNSYAELRRCVAGNFLGDRSLNQWQPELQGNYNLQLVYARTLFASQEQSYQPSVGTISASLSINNKAQVRLKGINSDGSSFSVGTSLLEGRQVLLFKQGKLAQATLNLFSRLWLQSTEQQPQKHFSAATQQLLQPNTPAEASGWRLQFSAKSQRFSSLDKQHLLQQGVEFGKPDNILIILDDQLGRIDSVQRIPATLFANWKFQSGSSQAEAQSLKGSINAAGGTWQASLREPVSARSYKLLGNVLPQLSSYEGVAHSGKAAAKRYYRVTIQPNQPGN